MYTDISSLSNDYTTNFGSIHKFYMAPVEWLEGKIALNKVSGTVKSPVVFLPGYDWLKLELVQDTGSYEELAKSSSAGDYFEVKLSGLVHKDSVERNTILNAMRYHKYLVVVFNYQGLKKIVGNTDNGMDLLTDFSTGAKIIDGTKYQITLRHMLEDHAPIYEPVLI